MRQELIAELWKALKLECCKRPDKAKLISFLSEKKFRKVLSKFSVVDTTIGLCIHNIPSNEFCADCVIDVQDTEHLRQRLFGNRQVDGFCHSTACSLWGDDGQGHADAFEQLPPCNCGALLNWEKHQAREHMKECIQLVESVSTVRPVEDFSVGKTAFEVKREIINKLRQFYKDTHEKSC